LKNAHTKYTPTETLATAATRLSAARTEIATSNISTAMARYVLYHAADLLVIATPGKASTSLLSSL